jgi:uncharacterized Zn ribbon protein
MAVIDENGIVIKDGKKVASVGAIGYNDYPTFKRQEERGIVPKGTADKRRALYKTRHDKDRKVKNSNGYLFENNNQLSLIKEFDKYKNNSLKNNQSKIVLSKKIFKDYSVYNHFLSLRSML